MRVWLGIMGLGIGAKTYRLLNEQSRRISACALTFFVNRSGRELRRDARFLDGSISMLDISDQPSLWQERVLLDEEFYSALLVLLCHKLLVRLETMCVRMEIPTLWRRGVGLSPDTRGSESRLAAYVETLSAALGHADRGVPFRSYCAGLLLPGARKSVEPMAARIEPGRVQAAHQSLHHFVAKADWSDEALLAAVRLRVLPIMQRRGPIRGWMVDDTGIPKKGSHSVGVARQYCGQIGKQDNCQVAVTLSLASDHASLPIAHRLYRRSSGPMMSYDARKPAFRTMWRSRPSRRSRLDKSAPPSPLECHWPRCWSMPAMASTPRFGTASPNSDWPMLSACSVTPVSGRRARNRCRPNPGADAGDRRR